MKDRALALANESSDPNEKMNRLREYVQASCLRSLHESGAFSSLSFVGGTALRFLYQLPRFSEDLGLSLEDKTAYKPEQWLAKLKRDLQFAGFTSEISWHPDKTVQSAWIRIEGLLAEARIVSRPSQKLSIKLEIDTNPPAGAETETRLVNRHFLFALRHHSLPCLMAGKIRALLTRPWTKGRDWYDLIWYCARIPPVHPAESFLFSSLAQGDHFHNLSDFSWKTALVEKLDGIDEKAMIADVEPFLERPADKDLLSKDLIRTLLLQAPDTFEGS